MRDVYLDTMVEVPKQAFAYQRDPGRAVIEMMREAAERLCEQDGARLRTDRTPEIVIKEGVDPLTGDDMVLMLFRWAAQVPESSRIS